MGDARTADARLERLLHVLPAAMAEGGAELDDLAEALDSTVDRILEDIDELTNRVFYQPGGWADDVQIFVEAGRVQVLHASGFERPLRLTPDETLCLAMALRGGAAEAHMRDEDRRDALLRRAEAHLAVRDRTRLEGGRVREGGGPGAEESAGDGSATTRDAAAIAAPERDANPDGIRATLLAAKRDRTPCAIWYVKGSATDGSVRVIHPYAIAYAEGAWYAVAHCAAEGGTRVFRLDRVLACDLASGTFDVPDDFRVEDFVAGGRVFFASESQETHDVRVRYSPRIARWIRERGQWEAEQLEAAEDGGVYVRYDVADPNWAVGHTLQYGADAEIVEPEEIRDLVRDVLGRMEA